MGNAGIIGHAVIVAGRTRQGFGNTKAGVRTRITTLHQLDQARVIVLDVADPRAHRPAGHFHSAHARAENLSSASGSGLTEHIPDFSRILVAEQG